jgi:tRNA/tmRNA/rRNA uracil-C5-methylase (TrmA/RlmC/RlmD family)
MKEPVSRGDVIELRIGTIAHGGHFIAHWGGRTFFVRHGIPGELVRVQVTDVTSKISRADAIEILEPSPSRVPVECSVAGPGGCGGCDFLHIAPVAQRSLKTTVLRDALIRQGGLTADEVDQFEVEALDDRSLGWRSRVRWSIDSQGYPGMHRHRSSEIVQIDECLLGMPEISRVPAIEAHESITAVRGGDGEVTVIADGQVIAGRSRVTEFVDGDEWRISAKGFWQVHPALANRLVDLACADVKPGEHWWDLYSGAGLFSRYLAEAVGDGRVDSVEAYTASVRDARRNLHECRQVAVHQADVATWLETAPGRPDGVVLDPPRSGAGEKVVTLIAERQPRTVVYVACDPVALGRDLAIFRAHGYRLSALTALDAFPMTHHFETVATLTAEIDGHPII